MANTHQHLIDMYNQHLNNSFYVTNGKVQMIGDVMVGTGPFKGEPWQQLKKADPKKYKEMFDQFCDDLNEFK